MRPAATHFVGILGWPLTYTLSPAIHHAAFRSIGLDWVYLTWPVPPDDLGTAVAGLRALGARGANVTMPHKEAVLDHVDEVSGDAQAVGAANTIQSLGGKLIAHNTDVDGFREFLVADAGTEVAGRRALVLGAGGAARAVVRALAELGAGEIAIAARDPKRAANLSALADRVETLPWAEAAAAVPRCDIIVNATPATTGAGDLLQDAAFNHEQEVVDLVYDPPTSRLVERARASGARAWGGLGMLVHQAAASFRIWTGQEPPIEAMSAAVVHVIGGARRHSGDE
ncbi:MAG TPA: shikimate dehydrogenase [Actinomycetota bacterium]|nr:shikimate dehydrogenase [Actinomycetota bacterium]